jgi:hypothetical protein
VRRSRTPSTQSALCPFVAIAAPSSPPITVLRLDVPIPNRQPRPAPLHCQAAASCELRLHCGVRSPLPPTTNDLRPRLLRCDHQIQSCQLPEHRARADGKNRSPGAPGRGRRPQPQCPHTNATRHTPYPRPASTSTASCQHRPLVIGLKSESAICNAIGPRTKRPRPSGQWRSRAPPKERAAGWEFVPRPPLGPRSCSYPKPAASPAPPPPLRPSAPPLDGW